MTANKNIYSMFHNSARIYPDRRALFAAETGYSYRELEQKVDAILPAIERAEQSFVGLFAHKSGVAYAGLLSILKAGKTYVPLNPSFPTSRNEKICQTTGIRWIIADRKHIHHLKHFLKGIRDRMTLILPDTPSSFAKEQFLQRHHLIFGEDLEDLVDGYAGRIEKDPFDIRPPADYAYLLFTSGSTGQPKGVPVSHRNFFSYIDHVNSISDFHEEDRFSQSFDLTFDPSMQDMFSAWSNGAALYCVPESYSFLPARFIAKNKLTVWHSVPSIAQLMKTYGMLRPGSFPYLRYSMFGGEPLPVDMATCWSQAAPNSVVENLYGPTEITVTISQYRWDPRSGEPPKSHNGVMSIGKIYPGHEWHLLPVDNEDTEPKIGSNGSPEDESQGELIVSGNQVVDSYFRNEQATRRHFMMRSEDGEPREPWYRTGDVMLADKEGDLFYLSRKDSQIKIRGNRVELDEIRYTIEQMTGPQTAVLIPETSVSGAAHQILLFLLESVKSTDQQIIGYCQSKLPAYMIPYEICRVRSFPLNRNGKMDHHRLRQVWQERVKPEVVEE